jgi:uncharacterized membrane protein
MLVIIIKLRFKYITYLKMQIASSLNTEEFRNIEGYIE